MPARLLGQCCGWQAMGRGGVLTLSKAQKSATAPTHRLLASVVGARMGSQDLEKIVGLSGFIAAYPVAEICDLPGP